MQEAFGVNDFFILGDGDDDDDDDDVVVVAVVVVVVVVVVVAVVVGIASLGRSGLRLSRSGLEAMAAMRLLVLRVSDPWSPEDLGLSEK